MSTVSYDVVFDDLEKLRAIVERGDRLMYSADNFADRSEFAEAMAAWRRTEERTRRLIGLLDAAAPIIVQTDEGEAIYLHVSEALDEEWTVPDPATEKIAPEEEA